MKLSNIFVVCLSIFTVDVDARRLRNKKIIEISNGLIEGNDLSDVMKEESEFFRVLEDSMSVQPPTPTPTTSRTTWDTITARPDIFSRFIDIAMQVGWDLLLQDPSVTRTIFVPSDDAFANLQPPDLLDKFMDQAIWGTGHLFNTIANHQLPGTRLEDDFSDGLVFFSNSVLFAFASAAVAKKNGDHRCHDPRDMFSAVSCCTTSLCH